MQLFFLGRTVATPAALDVLNPMQINTLLFRHQNGDWLDMDPDDKAANELALNPDDPGRVFSSFKIGGDLHIWVITEHDRSVTTVLLPEDY